MLRSKCQICGCTNDNACVTEVGPCWWIDNYENLCSACEALGTVERDDQVILNEAREWLSFITKIEPGMNEHVKEQRMKTLSWLIGQAERVQEMEKERQKRLKNQAKIVYERNCYCEALEKINYHHPTPIDIELDFEKSYDEVKAIARKALEGEE